MTTGRRKAKERREPIFGGRLLDLRPKAEDRVGGETRAPRGRKTPAKAKKRQSGGVLKRAAYWVAVLALWCGIAGGGLVVWIGMQLPPIQSLEVPKRPPSVRILASDGQLIGMRGEMAGSNIALKDMPPYLPKAFIAIEDRRFYSHFGIDVMGIARAAMANVMRRGVSQGGSTLTQQLAKNLFLTQERTFHRKLQEVMLALWLEHRFTKDQILELYLNRTYFGAGAYGVEAAAQRYFGRGAHDLTVAQSALLAGLVKSPSKLAPTRNLDGAERRAQVVIAAMAEMGFIPESVAQTALANPSFGLKAPSAGTVNYVSDWVAEVLEDLVGRTEADVTVETTVDLALQNAAEKALIDEMAAKAMKLNVSQGAIVSMTPDGAVRAMVGGRNYAESQFNRAVAARRQPGSSFKPFVYLTALERGMTPDTVKEDKPIDVKGWRPENFSREYFGPVTLQQALAMSLNTVAVRLALEVGPQSVVRTAHRLGIASRLEPNPSIALGTSEVSVLEMVGAFAPFANGGMAVQPYVIEKVRGADGALLYTHARAPLGRVIEPRYVGMMNTMMQETLLTGTAHKASLPGWQAAGKTGTSQDFRDAWFIGYTAALVTGVWMGNDNNASTKKMTGGGLPVEVWSRFMTAAHQGLSPAPLPSMPGEGMASVLPPAAPPNAVPRQQQQPASARGLDGWLLDTLFGRRN